MVRVNTNGYKSCITGLSVSNGARRYGQLSSALVPSIFLKEIFVQVKREERKNIDNSQVCQNEGIFSQNSLGEDP